MRVIFVAFFSGQRSTVEFSLFFFLTVEKPKHYNLLKWQSVGSRETVRREEPYRLCLKQFFSTQLQPAATTTDTKTSLKSEVAQTLSSLFYLLQFIKCWQFSLELNSKRLYRGSEKGKESRLVFTPSINKKLGINFSRRSRAVTVKKCTKKACCTCRAAVLPI